MAVNVSHENKFYTHAMTGLMDATKRRKILETNFDRKRLREYNEVCDEQIGYAVELLKIGAECEFKDDKISILADNEELIELDAEDIKEHLGEKDFYILFPLDESEDDMDQDLDMDVDSFDNDSYRRAENNIIPSMEELQKFMMVNPVNMMFPLLLESMQKSIVKTIPSSKDSYQGDPIAAIQDQMDNLKESREKMRKKAITYKKEYEKIREQYSDACKENEDLDRVATENQKLFLEEKQRFETEISILKTEIEDREKSILEKEKELSLIKEKMSEEQLREAENRKNDSVKMEVLNSEIETSKKEIESLKLEVELKQKELSDKQEKLSHTQHVLAQKQEEINHKEKKLNELNSEIEQLKNSEKNTEQMRKNLEEKIESLKGDKELIKKEKDSLLEKIKAEEERNAELQKKLANSSNNQDGNKKKIENIQNECNNIKNKNKDLERKSSVLEKEIKQAEEKYEKLMADYESLKEENSVLRETAYKDHKFDTGNALGFYAYINSKEKELKFVAVVDVCGMKEINAEYKEETGDNVINATIEALANEFEKDNIFRTRGAQFAITIDHGNYGQIRKHLENVKENLKRNQEFDIVYGLASSERSSSRMDMVNKARDEMKKMKNDWDLFNKPVDNTDDGYYDPSQYQTANYTQSESYENYNPDNMQDSTPANPNIAVNMMDDPYVDDNTVQEVDATSMDLARQIMEMMTPN